jgi:hypothetical protein
MTVLLKVTPVVSDGMSSNRGDCEHDTKRGTDKNRKIFHQWEKDILLN